MPDLPNIDLLQGDGKMPGVAPGVMEAPHVAARNMGKAIEGAGQQGLKIAFQMAEAKTQGQLAESRAQMRQAEADFAEFAATEMDQTQWGTEWEKRTSALSEQLLKAEGLSPEGRQQLELMLTKWRGDSSVRIQNQALEHGLQRARQGSLNAIEAAARVGDKEGVFFEIDQMVGVTPEGKEAMKQKHGRRMDFEAIYSMAEVDPEGAVAAAEAADSLSKYDVRRIKSHSRAAESRLQAEESEGIINDILSGDIKTDGEMEDALEQAAFLDDDKKNDVRKVWRGVMPMDPKTYRALSKEVDELMDSKRRVIPDQPNREHMLDKGDHNYDVKLNDLRRRINLRKGQPGADTLARRAGALTEASLDASRANLAKDRFGNLGKPAESFIRDADDRLEGRVSDEETAIVRFELEQKLADFMAVNRDELLGMKSTDAQRLLIEEVKKWEHDLTAPSRRNEVFGEGIEPGLPQSRPARNQMPVLPPRP